MRKKDESINDIKHTRRTRHIIIFLRLCIGFSACLVLILVFSINIIAPSERSFFEITRMKDGRTKVTVTGNTTTAYKSWKELEQSTGQVYLKPCYLPDGYELEKIIDRSNTQVEIAALYRDNKKTLKYYIYSDGHEVLDDSSDKKLLYEDTDTQYYQIEDHIKIVITRDKLIYVIDAAESLDVVKEIVTKLN